MVLLCCSLFSEINSGRIWLHASSLPEYLRISWLIRISAVTKLFLFQAGLRRHAQALGTLQISAFILRPFFQSFLGLLLAKAKAVMIDLLLLTYLSMFLFMQE